MPLAPEESPVHQLVCPWFQSERRPSPFQSQNMREALFIAALAEILARHAIREPYDPIIDPRFKWAIQHLELIEGTRPHIDPDIALHARMKFEKINLLSFKELAAHDT